MLRPVAIGCVVFLVLAGSGSARETESIRGFEVGTLFGLTHHASDGEGATVIGLPSSPTLGIPGIPSLYVSWFPVARMSVGSEFSAGRTAGDVFGITSLYFGGRGTYFPLGTARSGLYVLCQGALRHFDLRERPSVTDLAVGGGLGYRRRLGPAFVLRAEGRYRRWFDDGVDDFSLLFGLGAQSGGGGEVSSIGGPLYEIGTRFGFSRISSDDDSIVMMAAPGSPTSGVLGNPSIYLSWFPSARMSVGPEINIGRSSGSTIRTTSLNLGGRALFSLRDNADSGPYLLCNGAVLVLDVNEREAEADFSAGGGVGYQLRAGAAFLLRAEGQYRRWFDDEVNDFSLLVGLGARVGGR
ncbi:MAG: hypothetical protein OXU79_00445 [Gemmatimonadota bacterium]|nr:hypothetical protein [Gemmatimonadota bacterium]